MFLNPCTTQYKWLNTSMATFKYSDSYGANTAYSLIEERGYFPLDSIGGDYSRYTITCKDTRSKSIAVIVIKYYYYGL